MSVMGCTSFLPSFQLLSSLFGSCKLQPNSRSAAPRSLFAISRPNERTNERRSIDDEEAISLCSFSRPFARSLAAQFSFPSRLNRELSLFPSPPLSPSFSQKASVLMQRLSYPTETVLSNKISRNRIVLSFKGSPRKPLGRRPKEPRSIREDG